MDRVLNETMKRKYEQKSRIWQTTRRGGGQAKPPARTPYLFSRPPSTGRVAHRAGSAGLLSAYSNNGMAYSKTGRAKSILTIFRTANRIILGSTTTDLVERIALKGSYN